AVAAMVAPAVVAAALPALVAAVVVAVAAVVMLILVAAIAVVAMARRLRRGRQAEARNHDRRRGGQLEDAHGGVTPCDTLPCRPRVTNDGDFCALIETNGAPGGI